MDIVLKLSASISYGVLCSLFLYEAFQYIKQKCYIKLYLCIVMIYFIIFKACRMILG